MSDTFDAGFEYLASQGLNLSAVLDCATLPNNIREPMSASLQLSEFSRLVELGNTGTQFCQALQAFGMPDKDPMDAFSHSVTKTFCENYLDGASCQLVFPTKHIIPLQRIGTFLGWGHVSPLGVGISEKHGLWWAYRSAFLTTAELPVTEPLSQKFACDDCVDKPCIIACPASAVSTDETFDVDACFHFRAHDNSPCVDKCLARLACPIGAESRYPDEMIHYIYQYSMSTVRSYVEDSSIQSD